MLSLQAEAEEWGAELGAVKLILVCIGPTGCSHEAAWRNAAQGLFKCQNEVSITAANTEADLIHKLP